MVKKKIKVSLPKEIINFGNVDKMENESWNDGKHNNIANFPCPCRILLCGSCGLGKTNLVKNILLNARPLYDRVILIHPDIMISKEYEDIEPTDCLTDIPDPKYWTEILEGKDKMKKIV